MECHREVRHYGASMSMSVVARAFGFLKFEVQGLQVLRKKVMLALPCPRPRPNALPGPVGAWSGVGRRGPVLFSPPCPRSWVPSSCLYPVLVTALLCG